MYDLATGQLARLNHPQSTFGGWMGGICTSDSEIVTTWESATQPASLIALDSRTGELLGRPDRHEEAEAAAVQPRLTLALARADVAINASCFCRLDQPCCD